MPRRRTKDLHLPERVYVRHGAVHFVDGMGKWHRLGKAWDFEAKLAWARLTGEQVAPGTLGPIMTRYLELAKPRLAPRTYADYSEAIVLLRKIFGSMRPDDVTSADVAEYLERNLVAKRGVRANREIAALSNVFQLAMRKGQATRNPCYGVERNPEKPRTRLVTADELAAFVTWARKKGFAGELFAAAAEIQYLTAQRPGDVRRIRLQDLSEDGIAFVQGKTGVRVLVEWTERLQSAVEAAKGLKRGKGVVAFALLGNRQGQVYTEKGWKASWSKLMRAWVKEGHERFRQQDLRPAGVTKMREDGRAAEEVSGHRERATIDTIYDRRRTRRGKAVD